ncbi:MAG: KH domain-containing protein [Fusobacteriaceae bacterium]|nr:KH domain-containing protein [Fusobacteriaceae bacterium]MBP9509748.1 KH domain-containing protein [Fusobacteriaceae bacterium]
MQNTIEIKAMSKDAAIQRALKILEATSEQVVSVIEKEKSKSFLGLFNKEGLYAITVDKDKKEEEKKEKLVAKPEINEVKKSEEKVIKKEQKIETVKSEKKEERKDKPAVKVDKAPKNDIILSKTRTLLNFMNLNLDAEITSVEGKYYVVNLFGDDNGIIIGKKGKTLNSFEYLLNSMIKDCRMEIDVEGFKDKRNETLRELAKKMAEKALSTNKTIRLNPMPPRERKIIHEIINQYSELDTFSEGKDPKRYIVIKRKK